jgi:hypothetical protein
MFTQSRLESVEAARLQLIDLGDEKTAKTLNWVVLALGCIRSGVQAQDHPAMLVADLVEHINAMSEQLGDAAPDPRALMAKVNVWLEQREQQAQAQVMRDFGQSAQAALHSGRVWSEIQPVHVHGDPCRYCQRVRDEPCSQFVSRASAEARDCEGLKDLRATGGYELPARAAAELDRMLHAQQPVQAPTTGREVERTAPARIYLNVSDSAEHFDMPFPKDPHGDEVTWSEDKALDCCVGYVRADTHAELAARFHRSEGLINRLVNERDSVRGCLNQWIEYGGRINAALGLEVFRPEQQLTEIKRLRADAKYPEIPEGWKLVPAHDPLYSTRRDADLLRWLRPRFLAVDWDWNGNGTAIVFKFPSAATVSADLDATLRSAMTLES